MYVCTYTYYACAHVLYLCTHVCMHERMHVCFCVCICMYVCMVWSNAGQREREREAQELQELDAWATEYWGNEEVVEIVDDGGEADAMGRPELGQPLPQPGAEPRRPELQPPLPPQTEGRVRVRGPNNQRAAVHRTTSHHRCLLPKPGSPPQQHPAWGPE